MKKRNHGIDALRVLSMYLVVVIHMFSWGGLFEASHGGGRWISTILYNASFCAVNCFALISGYVMVNVTELKLHNLLKLWSQVFFYSVGMLMLLGLWGSVEIPKSSAIKYLFPTLTNRYWYFTSYCQMFIIIPFMNHILQTCSKEKIALFFQLAFFVFCCVHCVPFFRDSLKLLDLGYSSAWLSLCYMFGGFIKRFGYTDMLPSCLMYFSHRLLGLSNQTKTVGVIVMYCLCIVINSAIHICTGFTTLTCYVSPTVFIEALCLLYVFANISATKWIKIIAFWSPTSFGVYLIHTHLLFLTTKWKGAFTFIASYPTWLIPIAVVICALGVYVLCSGIDFIRIWIFKMVGSAGKRILRLENE